MKTNYLANVVGDDLLDAPLAFETGGLAVGDDGVVVIGGDPGGVVAVVRADDEHDAERRIVATFGDAATIDDLTTSANQDPFEVADCGCVAWGDGTGSPCAAHHPDAAEWDPVAHALAPCADPDCEIHHPEVAVAEGVATRMAVAWFLAGASWGREHPDSALNLRAAR